MLLLLGDGPLKNDIEKKCKEFSIAEKVKFIGNIREVEEYYSIMDVFLFPSLYEGLGMTLIEAQVNGLTCFASDNVPLEAKVNLNFEFISLTKSATYWSNEIVRNKKHINLINSRICNQSSFLKSKYDIRFEANNLLQKYNDMVRDKIYKNNY